MHGRVGSYLRQNVLALTALVVALTGVAYAAAPRNSVVSKSIRDGGVKNQDLAANAVDSARVTDASLGGADVSNESLGGADVLNESLGGADVLNESLTGADISGLTGADITYGAHVVSSPNDAADSIAFVTCPPGEIATGGGGLTTDTTDSGNMHQSRPLQGMGPNPTGWQVNYASPAAAGVIGVYVVCMPA